MGQPRGPSRVFLRQICIRLFVSTAPLLGGASLAECPVSLVTFRSDLSFSLTTYSFQQQSDDDEGGARGVDQNSFLAQFVPRSTCVCHENVCQQRRHDGNDDDLESLAIQSGSKLSLHDTGGSRSAHTDTHIHTHTDSKRGDNGARSQRAALCMRTRHTERESGRERPRYSVKRGGRVPSRR